MKSISKISCEDTTVQLKTFGSPLLFRIPVLDDYIASKIPAEAAEEAGQLHIRYRLEAEPQTSHERTKSKAEVELKVMISFFPNIHDSKVIAAVTAWFYLNCHVDDLIEEMGPDAARAVLKEVPGLLRGTGLSQASVPMVRSDSGNASSADEDMAQQVRYVFDWTRQHMQALLPLAVYDDLCPAMIATFEAMYEEVTFRESRSQDLKKYLSIRVQTIALFTLFKLVHFSVGGDPQAFQHFDKLAYNASLAAGLQNDIVGIDKDIAKGEWMNYPMVYAEGCEPTETVAMIEKGALKGVKSHNHAVDVAMEQFNAILAEGSMDDLKVAAGILIIVVRHFKWVCVAKRYKS